MRPSNSLAVPRINALVLLGVATLGFDLHLGRPIGPDAFVDGLAGFAPRRPRR
jgi:hypothetical protein